MREVWASDGLLPLVVQFPIWLALFRVLSEPTHIPAESALRAAIESGQTRFLGMDLGLRVSEAVSQGIVAGLPYLLMLAVMIATQYVQQWHATAGQVRPDNPQAAATQAVTKIMPLFIGFVSYNFPAGLVLYWMTGNIFRLGQQVVIFRIDGRPTVPAIEAKPRPTQDDNKPPARPQSGAADRRRRRKRK